MSTKEKYEKLAEDYWKLFNDWNEFARNWRDMKQFKAENEALEAAKNCKLKAIQCEKSVIKYSSLYYRFIDWINGD